MPRESLSAEQATDIRGRIGHIKKTLCSWAEDEGVDPDVAAILAAGLLIQDSGRIAWMGGFDPTLAGNVARRARAGGLWCGRGRIGADWTGPAGGFHFLLDVMTAEGRIYRYRHRGEAYYSISPIVRSERLRIRVEAGRRPDTTALIQATSPTPS